MSFTAAAQELNVSQTAISHQVRKLEEQLGIKLFERTGTSISLTDAGAKIMTAAGDSFDNLDRAVSRVQAEHSENILTISVTPSFASKWLVRRLGRFWHKYPEIQLRIHHSLELVDFSSDDIDLAIRAGNGDWSGAVTKLPLALELYPICHPSILTGRYPLKEPGDLKHYNLLHEDNYEDWTRWLGSVDVKDIDPKSGYVMNDSNSLGIAVENGQGVALGRSALIESDLLSGIVSKPFEHSIPSPFDYYLVCPKANLEKLTVMAFREFVLKEAGSH